MDDNKTAIDAIVNELKVLPPEQLEQAAAFIHHLRQTSQEERLSTLRRLSGCITQEEADEWLKAVEDCEHIDESGW